MRPSPRQVTDPEREGAWDSQSRDGSEGISNLTGSWVQEMFPEPLVGPGTVLSMRNSLANQTDMLFAHVQLPCYWEARSGSKSTNKQVYNKGPERNRWEW